MKNIVTVPAVNSNGDKVELVVSHIVSIVVKDNYWEHNNTIFDVSCSDGMVYKVNVSFYKLIEYLQQARN